MGITTNIVQSPTAKRQYTLTELRNNKDLRGKVFDEVRNGRKCGTIRVAVLDGQPHEFSDSNNIVLHVTENCVVRRWLDGDEYKFELADEALVITITN